MGDVDWLKILIYIENIYLLCCLIPARTIGCRGYNYGIIETSRIGDGEDEEEEEEEGEEEEEEEEREGWGEGQEHQDDDDDVNDDNNEKQKENDNADNVVSCDGGDAKRVYHIK